ncbi:MAG: hypothetical protein HY902_19875 [Deltaproteobacteria bacterium]|nr:hypothetical protein [Deltaproteobacteria bacterium]
MGKMLHKSLIALLLCAVALPVLAVDARAQAPAGLPAAASAVGLPAAATAASPVHIDVKWSNTQPVFGERVELRVTLTYPTGYRVFFPTKPDLRPLLVDTRDPGKVERVENAGTVTETIVIPALAVRVGLAKTPPIEVPWQAGAQGSAEAQAGTLTVPPSRLQVKSQFASETNVEPSPLPAPRPLVEENTPLEIALAAAALMLLAALLTAVGLKYYRDRAAKRAPKERVPAHVVALKRLDEFDRSGRAETAEPREVFAELSEILREYLGARYHFAALDMTTTELLAQLQAVEVRGVQPGELQSFAELSDLVKFARVPASGDELRNEAGFVRKVVERTMLTAMEQEALRKAEAERLARQKRLRLAVMAPAPLRLRAFAIDLFVGALLCALLGWVAIDTGSKLLFDLSYVLILAWLVVRDGLAAQSPGKAVVGLQIANHDDGEDPTPVRWHHSEDDDVPTAQLASLGARLGRNLLFALPLAGLIAEAVTCLYLPEMRRMGDQWAATRVIDARYGTRRGTPGWVPAILLVLLAGLLTAMPLLLGGRPG